MLQQFFPILFTHSNECISSLVILIECSIMCAISKPFAEKFSSVRINFSTNSVEFHLKHILERFSTY